MSEVDISKYAALYEYQKNQFSIVKGHYEKLEDKATKYLTYLSIFIINTKQKSALTHIITNG